MADFTPVTRNGQEYIYDMPVLATGVLENVTITDKDGTIHSAAAGASDVTGQGGLGAAVATSAGGMSDVAGGLTGGLLSGLFNFISMASAPTIELVIRNDETGDAAPLRVSQDSLYILSKYRCVDIGDRVRIVKNGTRGFDIYNAVPELLRLSDFQPSCEELKTKIVQGDKSEPGQDTKTTPKHNGFGAV